MAVKLFSEYHKEELIYGALGNDAEMAYRKNIGVAILDTGIYPHIDFDCRIRAFLDMVHGRTLPYDDNGHGTHVAGILAGSGAALNGKYKGVAPGCDIIAVKVLDESGNGNKEQVIEALDWIKANRIKYNIRIINISVGTTQKESHRDLIYAVESAWDDGFIVVAAAGNMGPGQGSITAPGSSRKVITVGSADMLVRHQGISGRGPTCDCIIKPGYRGTRQRHCLLCQPKRQHALCSEKRHIHVNPYGLRRHCAAS